MNNIRFDYKSVNYSFAKRENNNKRNFLIVNLDQAKHYPVSPHIALNMYKKLFELLELEKIDRKIAVIGFAETATAIGAYVSYCIGGSTFYIQTTREKMLNVSKVVDFSENHSHAVEQAIYCNSWSENVATSDVIIFVEDEVTTGNTIMNFLIKAKEQCLIKPSADIIILSILNLMENDAIEKFENQGIDIKYLKHIDQINIVSQFDIMFKPDFIYNHKFKNTVSKIIEIKGKLDPRAGVSALEYQCAVKLLCNEVLEKIYNDLENELKILVIGTEECMYPAIILGNEIEKKYTEKIVKTHSTTRSPIMVSNENNYPLGSGFKMESLYEIGRINYIYNIFKYDLVIVVTDATEINNNGANALEKILRTKGNEKIIFVRWF